MRLSREEFWVLDVTAQLNCSLHLHDLNRQDADLLFNKRHHGLSTNDLVDLIVFMQRRGDLVVFRDADCPHPEFDAYERALPRGPGVRIVIDFTSAWENPIFYSKKAIVRDFFDAEQYQLRNPRFPKQEKIPDTMLCFCATPQGAAKWEETAQVDWAKYLDASGGWVEDADLAENQSLMTWRAGAVSRQTLDAYFEWKTKWASYLYSWETVSFKRYHTECFTPWKATYWKTFPEGFECDFLEFTVHRTRGLVKKESEIADRLGAGYWPEHHALFDWCNAYVRDFPFEGD